MVPFLTLENIHVAYFGNEALSGISLAIEEGEHWAVTGGSGSGKTTLLEAIAGRHLIREGAIHHHYYQRFIQSRAINDPLFNYKRLLAEVSLQHHFKNRYNLNEFYYQQRFNSVDADEAVSVGDYLAGLGEEAAGSGEDVVGPDGEAAGSGGEEKARMKIIRELHLEELLDKSLIKLSNGETRRLLFAAALMKRPLLLLLDAPFTGLDVATRPYFHELINRLMASGLTIIMATSENEIPEGVTHVARLEKGRLAGVWKRKDFELIRERAAMEVFREGGKCGGAQGARVSRGIGQLTGAGEFRGAKEPSTDVTAGDGPDRMLLEKLLANPSPSAFDYAVRMRDVSISYGNEAVLQQVNWEVKQGERWALSGHNGAGKSTLLSLINADNPQAYANDLVLFDRKRGSGESIWDIKKKIGYVSPEMHQYFKTADTCLQVVLSGFFDTLGLIRKCSPEQKEQAASWLDILGIGDITDKLFRHCPLSTQRLVLIARALVKNPPLLILDEPCQGMDAEQIQRIRLLIDAVCGSSGTTLIYVSHYLEEIPSCVDKLLKLEQGKVVYRGPFPSAS